jgi:AraC family transcriptional regulator of adaptative response / DNA-3-methyladenine glycosylase II
VRVQLTGRTPGYVACRFTLADVRDLAPALERTRRLLDADCDPLAVDDQLGLDPVLAALVRGRPGLRVPGHVDGAELAARALLGQQVSVPAARTLAARLVATYGAPLELTGDHQVTHSFPTARALSEVDPEQIAMPRARGRALRAISTALASGRLALDRSADRAEVRGALLELPGVGLWTADYIALRGLGDPDVFLPTDLGVKRAAARLGLSDLPAAAEGWRPWRSYALMHLWTSVSTSKES